MNYLDSFTILIGSSLLLIGLGLVTGFSPILYVTQIGLAARSHRALSHMIALIIGVIAGTLLLLGVFQFFHPQTIVNIVDATVTATSANTWFNIVAGIVFIVIGISTIRRKKPARAVKEDRLAPTKTNYGATISFSGIKTIASGSGAAAIFLAGTIITDTSVGFLGSLILLVVFITATSLPFGIITLVGLRSPKRLKQLRAAVESFMQKINTQLVVGILIMSIGGLIIGFSILTSV